MLPFILAGVGGYLLYDSLKSEKFADGGKPDGGMMAEAIPPKKEKLIEYIVYNRDVLLRHYDEIMDWTSKDSSKYINLLKAIKGFDEKKRHDWIKAKLFGTPIPSEVFSIGSYSEGELYEIADDIRFHISLEHHNSIHNEDDDDPYYSDGGTIESKQQIVDAVLEEMKKNVVSGDITVEEELFMALPKEALVKSFDEEKWNKLRKLSKQEIVDEVLEQMKKNVNEGDVTVEEELLMMLPKKTLQNSLPN